MLFVKGMCSGRERQYDVSSKHNQLQRLKKLWVAKRIISISNGFEVDQSDASLHIGTVVDVISITTSEVAVAIVKYDDESTEEISFATIIEYSDSLWDALQKLTAKERWEIAQSIVYRFVARN